MPKAAARASHRNVQKSAAANKGFTKREFANRGFGSEVEPGKGVKPGHKIRSVITIGVLPRIVGRLSKHWIASVLPGNGILAIQNSKKHSKGLLHPECPNTQIA
jgi:hypothetical protein